MGQFKIGIIADMLRMPFAESMEQCARMGADGVQIYAVSEEMLSASEEELKRRKKIIQACRFPPSAAIWADMALPDGTRM